MLVGDPQQLPPTVKSRTALDLGLGVSLFARLQRMGMAPMLLDTQYRCLSEHMGTWAVHMSAHVITFGRRAFYSLAWRHRIGEEPFHASCHACCTARSSHMHACMHACISSRMYATHQLRRECTACTACSSGCIRPSASSLPRRSTVAVSSRTLPRPTGPRLLAFHGLIRRCVLCVLRVLRCYGMPESGAI